MKFVAVLLLTVAATLATTGAQLNTTPAPEATGQDRRDPNIRDRVDAYRPPSLRVKTDETNTTILPPIPPKAKVSTDPNAAPRFQIYRPRDGRALKVENSDAVDVAAPPS